MVKYLSQTSIQTQNIFLQFINISSLRVHCKWEHYFGTNYMLNEGVGEKMEALTT